MIHLNALLAVTGELATSAGSNVEPLKSPGLLRKHYAPRARLVIVPWHNEAELLLRCAAWAVPQTRIHVIAHTRIPSAHNFGSVSVIPHDAQAFARAIYAQLHECDEAGAELILIEALPETDEWGALSDRLTRAAAG